MTTNKNFQRVSPWRLRQLIKLGFLSCLGLLQNPGHSAPKSKAKPTTKSVLKSKPTAPSQNDERRTPVENRNDALGEAILLNDTGKVATLLQGGAQINGADSILRTPLAWALAAQGAGAEMTDMIRFLRDKGAKLSPKGIGGAINSVAISSAFEADNAGIIQALVNVYGASFYKDYHDDYEKTPLRMAAVAAASESAKVLLKAGANPNAEKYALGQTLLMQVGQNGPVLKTLILTTYGGKTPQETAKRLAEAEEKEKSFVRLLVASGVPLNAQDNEGNTALILAAENGSPHLAQELLHQGADPNITNEDGQTALIAVVTKGQQHIQAIMASVEDSLRAGGTIKIPATKSSEQTKLLREADKVDSAVVRALLFGKADPNIKDKSGNTVLTYAVSDKRTAIIQLLRGNTSTKP